MFLGSEKIAEELVDFSDVVELGIFAHTHMDEVRLLEPESGSPAKGVAVKMVSSISPINAMRRPSRLRALTHRLRRWWTTAS